MKKGRKRSEEGRRKGEWKKEAVRGRREGYHERVWSGLQTFFVLNRLLVSVRGGGGGGDGGSRGAGVGLNERPKEHEERPEGRNAGRRMAVRYIEGSGKKIQVRTPGAWKEGRQFRKERKKQNGRKGVKKKGWKSKTFQEGISVKERRKESMGK